MLELEREDFELKRKETQLRESMRPWLARLVSLSRPLQIAVGLIGMVLGALVFSSLFMTK